MAMSSGSVPSSSMVPQDSALRVVKGSLGVSLTATALGSAYGVMKAQPASLYAFQSGANSFVFAFPFFALREYVVSPLLTKDIEQTSMHTRNLGSSAISGAVVGGAMSGYFRGPQKIFSGSSTFGILCTLLQFLGNELRVVRIHMLAGRGGGGSSFEQPSPSLRKEETKADAALPVDSPPAGEQPPEAVAVAATPAATQAAPEPGSRSWFSQAGSYLYSFSPIKKISDEEYQQSLQATRRKVLQQLREVDRDIANEATSAHKQQV